MKAGKSQEPTLGALANPHMVHHFANGPGLAETVEPLMVRLTFQPLLLGTATTKARFLHHRADSKENMDHLWP